MSTETSTGADSDVGVERAEEFAREHPGLVKFARVGWVAKGVVYAFTGLLALLIGIHSVDGSESGEGTEASQTGAIARIAQNPFGSTLLYLMAAGLVIYAIWRLVTVALPADNGVKGWLTRGGYLGSAITYLLLSVTAIGFAANPAKSDDGEDSKVSGLSSEFMSHTGGRVAIIVAGVVLIVIAAAFLHKAIGATFTSQLFPGNVGPVSHRVLVVLGRIGWVGRSAMMALIGFFLAQAAVDFSPDEAQGLDGSLRKAASSGAGTVLVIAVGVGLLVYGVFCALSAPKRRLVGADS